MYNQLYLFLVYHISTSQDRKKILMIYGQHFEIPLIVSYYKWPMDIFRVSGQLNVNLEAIGQGFPERLVPGTRYIVGMLDYYINNNTEYIGGRASWKTSLKTRNYADARYFHITILDLVLTLVLTSHSIKFLKHN